MKRVARPLTPFLMLISLSAVGLMLGRGPQEVQLRGVPRKAPDFTANMKPRSVFGAYYLVGDGFTSTLGLNNSTQFPLTVYPTLYSPAGIAMPMAAVTVPPNSPVQVNMADWVGQLGGEFRTGSWQLDYHSALNAIGAQMLVTDESRSLTLDVPVHGRHEYRSSKLEAVWWAFDTQSEMKVVIVNTTDSAAQTAISVTASDGREIKSLPIPLGAHHSRVVNLRDIVARDGTVGGVSIEHDGKPGAVMAEGFVTLASKGFSSNIRFHDPVTFGGNALHGAGVYLPQEATPFEGHLMLRNISGETVTAHPVLRHGDQEIDLGELALGPGASKEMKVQKIMSEEDGQGTAIEVSYTGLPGSLIGHWISVDKSGSMVVETPLRNPGSSTAGFLSPLREILNPCSL